MKKAAIYARVSTADQHLETQLYDLRKLAAIRGFEVSREYYDSSTQENRNFPRPSQAKIQSLIVF
jgi:DNA invertase Pin-like site-specific DNA recombinase